ncbi:MAG: TfoX/Sxy family DNA transformation protein [Sediminibacterium sp.]
MSDLSEIKNFGPYMVKIMHEIGIFTKEDLMNADYRQIKTALINKGIQPHLNIFYSIEMGLQNRVWNDITLQEKKEIQEIVQ